MSGQGKGFLNLNRFKSSKAIKQYSKLKAEGGKNKTIRKGKHGRSK